MKSCYYCNFDDYEIHCIYHRQCNANRLSCKICLFNDNDVTIFGGHGKPVDAYATAVKSSLTAQIDGDTLPQLL